MARLNQLKPKLQTLKSNRTINTASSTPTTDTQTITKPKKNWGRGSTWKWRNKTRPAVLKRDGYTCQHCKRIGGRLEVDHKINVARGGTDDLDNLQTLCHDCHKTKTSKESQGRGDGKV